MSNRLHFQTLRPAKSEPKQANLPIVLSHGQSSNIHLANLFTRLRLFKKFSIFFFFCRLHFSHEPQIMFALQTSIHDSEFLRFSKTAQYVSQKRARENLRLQIAPTNLRFYVSHTQASWSCNTRQPTPLYQPMNYMNIQEYTHN